MDDVEIIYDGEIPDVVKVEIRNYVEEVVWLLPRWVQSVHVFWKDTDEGNCVAKCLSNYEYRWVRLTFFAAFHTQPDPLMVAIHETCHGITGPLTDWFEEQINILTEDNELLKKVLLAELGNRTEAVTQDLAWIIHKRVWGRQTVVK